MVGKAAELTPLIAAPIGVEVTSRRGDSATFYFLLNQTEESHTAIALPHWMNDLIGETQQITQISLGPLESAVLASSEFRTVQIESSLATRSPNAGNTKLIDGGPPGSHQSGATWLDYYR
jgi:Beta-galactosidase C-terminal domain